MKKLLCYAIVVSLALAFSCESPEVKKPSTPELSQPGSVLEYIKSLGYDDDKIVDEGEYYLVDGDMAFPKNMVMDAENPGNSGGRVKQRYVSTVSGGYRSNIRLFVDPSMTNMMAEITGAVDHWNSVVNTSIRFVIVSGSPYDIKISNVDLGENTCGRGAFPSGGAPGSWVYINQIPLQGQSFQQRRRTIIHELGHTIGLDHTNESTGSPVPGVPNTDAASLMNGGQCTWGATVLSANDRAATVSLYPVPAEELYIVRTGTMFAADYTTGIGVDLNTGWGQTVAMASTGGYIYTVTAGSMYQINPNNNAAVFFSDTPNGWAGTEAMAAYGNYLFAVQGGTLYSVNVNNGDVTPYSDYPTGWAGTEAMAAYGNYLFVVQGGTLYSVNLSNGDVAAYSDTPNGWAGTEAMAAYGGYLFAVQGGTLYSVNLSNGDVAPYSDYPNGWVGTEALTAKDNYLFGSQAGALWKVNLSTGGVTQLGTDNWSGTEAMAARL